MSSSKTKDDAQSDHPHVARSPSQNEKDDGYATADEHLHHKGRVLVSGSSKETAGTEVGWQSEEEEPRNTSWNLFASPTTAKQEKRPQTSPHASPRDTKRVREATTLHASPAPGVSSSLKKLYLYVLMLLLTFLCLNLHSGHNEAQ